MNSNGERPLSEEWDIKMQETGLLALDRTSTGLRTATSSPSEVKGGSCPRNREGTVN